MFKATAKDLGPKRTQLRGYGDTLLTGNCHKIIIIIIFIITIIIIIIVIIFCFKLTNLHYSVNKIYNVK